MHGTGKSEEEIKRVLGTVSNICCAKMFFATWKSNER